MKQTKRMLSLLALFLLASILPISVYAHPGRTDSNGGHNDSSTGEYHYHHGYSAHQHYDMDGDGIIDCPYDFKSNVNTSQKTSTSSEQESNNGITSDTESGNQENQKESTFSDFVNIFPAVVAIIAFSLYFISYPLMLFNKDWAALAVKLFIRTIIVGIPLWLILLIISLFV